MRQPVPPINSFASPNSAFEPYGRNGTAIQKLPPIVPENNIIKKDTILQRKNAFKYIKNLFCPTSPRKYE